MDNILYQVSIAIWSVTKYGKFVLIFNTINLPRPVSQARQLEDIVFWTAVIYLDRSFVTTLKVSFDIREIFYGYKTKSEIDAGILLLYLKLTS